MSGTRPVSPRCRCTLHRGISPLTPHRTSVPRNALAPFLSAPSSERPSLGSLVACTRPATGFSSTLLRPLRASHTCALLTLTARPTDHSQSPTLRVRPTDSTKARHRRRRRGGQDVAAERVCSRRVPANICECALLCISRSLAVNSGGLATASDPTPRSLRPLSGCRSHLPT